MGLHMGFLIGAMQLSKKVGDFQSKSETFWRHEIGIVGEYAPSFWWDTWEMRSCLYCRLLALRVEKL